MSLFTFFLIIIHALHNVVVNNVGMTIAPANAYSGLIFYTFFIDLRDLTYNWSAQLLWDSLWWTSPFRLGKLEVNPFSLPFHHAHNDFCIRKPISSIVLTFYILI